MNSDAKIVRGKIGIGHVQHDAPADSLAFDVVDACTKRDSRSIQPETGKAGESGWLKQDAGANWLRRIETLVDMHLVPSTRKKRCGSEPCSACTRYTNAQWFHG